MSDHCQRKRWASLKIPINSYSLLCQEDLPPPWEKDKYLEAYIDYRPNHIWPSSRKFQSLTDRIYDQANIGELITGKYPKTVAKARARRRTELASLLWHCLLAFHNKFVSSEGRLMAIGLRPSYTEVLLRPDYVEFTIYPFVKMSLNKSDYRVGSTDNPLRITDNIIRILRALHEHEFVELQAGFFNKDSGNGKQSRFRPDHRLDIELRKLSNLSPERWPKPKPNSFRLRTNACGRKRSNEARWKEVDLQHRCPDLQRNEELIERYNDFIQSQELDLVGAKCGVLIVPTAANQFQCVHSSNRYFQNIYHIEDDGSLTYGRMHGGFWQNMPSRYRHLIRINHEPVVILDFKAMILNIVAGLGDHQLHGDPYSIDVGLGNKNKAVQRKLIKSVLIVGINAKNSIATASAVLNEHASDFKEAFGRSLTRRGVLNVIDALLERYAFLQPCLFKGLGKTIFAIDAEIARGVIRECLDANIPVLPIHDGFVVARSYRGFLNCAMQAGWGDCFTTTIGIDEE